MITGLSGSGCELESKEELATDLLLSFEFLGNSYSMRVRLVWQFQKDKFYSGGELLISSQARTEIVDWILSEIFPK